VLLEMRPSGRGDVCTTIRLDKSWFVQPTRRLVDELVGLLGQEQIVLSPRRATANGGNHLGQYRRVAAAPPLGRTLLSPASGRVD
jgi:hypothetical protein